MQGTGKDWDVREMVWNHNCPFLKKIEEAVEAVDAIVDGFLKLSTRGGQGIPPNQ